MATGERDQLDAQELARLDYIEAAEAGDAVDRALSAARERLHMDASYVSTITPEVQRVDQIVGGAAFGLEPGREIPIDETFCSRMLQGDIPHVVADTNALPEVRDLRAAAMIGAYVGVPVTLSDGSTHGTLCCASREPRSDLGDDELRFMWVLAGIVAKNVELARDRRTEAEARLIDARIDLPDA